MTKRKITAFTARYLADRALDAANRKAAKLRSAADRADKECEKRIVQLQQATTREWNTKKFIPRKQ